jgi:hypothetical protein
MLAPNVGESSQDSAARPRVPAIGFCQEKNRLLDEFLKASREIVALQNEQAQAVIHGDADFPRFDVLLHLAQDKKEMAKYAWIAHVESHGCEEG